MEELKLCVDKRLGISQYRQGTESCHNVIWNFLGGKYPTQTHHAVILNRASWEITQVSSVQFVFILYVKTWRNNLKLVRNCNIQTST